MITETTVISNKRQKTESAKDKFTKPLERLQISVGNSRQRVFLLPQELKQTSRSMTCQWPLKSYINSKNSVFSSLPRIDLAFSCNLFQRAVSTIILTGEYDIYDI